MNNWASAGDGLGAAYGMWVAGKEAASDPAALSSERDKLLETVDSLNRTIRNLGVMLSRQYDEMGKLQDQKRRSELLADSITEALSAAVKRGARVKALEDALELEKKASHQLKADLATSKQERADAATINETLQGDVIRLENQIAYERVERSLKRRAKR